MGLYILEGKKPTPTEDVLAWGEWFQTADRAVARTELPDCEVSTVFLGVDHQWGEGPPLLFETMVFGGKLDGEMRRYSTWEEAEVGHDAVVEGLVAGESVAELEGGSDDH